MDPSFQEEIMYYFLMRTSWRFGWLPKANQTTFQSRQCSSSSVYLTPHPPLPITRPFRKSFIRSPILFFINQWESLPLCLTVATARHLSRPSIKDGVCFLRACFDYFGGKFPVSGVEWWSPKPRQYLHWSRWGRFWKMRVPAKSHYQPAGLQTRWPAHLRGKLQRRCSGRKG